MIQKGKTSILFVCTGNICRSPTAEGVMRSLVARAGLQNRVIVDSAGTHDYHVGAAPDPRAIAAARRRGYDLAALRARLICEDDFVRSDLILAMDFNNLEILQGLCPSEHQSKIRLLMTYAPARCAAIVHDPYCRGAKDFDLVLDYIEDACRGLVTALVSEPEHALPIMPNRQPVAPTRAAWGLR
jgi:protein-tyrosine phosphatase